MNLSRWYADHPGEWPQGERATYRNQRTAEYNRALSKALARRM
ncbi:hypothetical protein [Bifidobacterium amazonense]|nr:hypothetical protein [Bifidobacterium amazonense]